MRGFRFAGVLVGLIGCCLIGGAASAGAAVQSPATEVTLGAGFGGGGVFYAVSCVSAGTCTAVGEDGNGLPLAVDESAGAWGAPSEVALGGGTAAFRSVSCTAAATCTAAGTDSNNQPFVVDEVAGVWASPTGLPLDDGFGGGGTVQGISCATVGNCTVVGFDNNFQPFAVNEWSGVWGSPIGLPFGTGAVPEGVSCASLGNCTVAGWDLNNQPFFVDESNGFWGSPTELTLGAAFGNGGNLKAVSCAAAASCTAVGTSSNGKLLAFDRSGNVWTPSEVAGSGGAAFFGLSCVSAGTCTGVGSFHVGLDGPEQAFTAEESGGVWGPSTTMALGDAFGGGGSLRGVSCTSPHNCTSVGFDLNFQPIYQQPNADAGSTLTGPTAGSVGNQLTYHAAVSNGGTATTTVDYTLSPSAPVKLNGFTGPAGCAAAAGGAVSCSVSLDPGDSFAVTYRVVAPTSGGLTVTGSASSADGYVDPNHTDNSASVNTTVAAVKSTFYTSVSDAGFPVATINLKGPGTTVFWNNLGPGGNEVADASGLNLFDLTLGAPVDFGRHLYGASGSYEVTDLQGDSSETIVVPLVRSPKAGSVTTAFGFNWAAFPAPTGFQYEVGIKRPGSKLWQPWQTTTLSGGEFTPDRGTGTYTFRARLLRTGTNTASGWVQKAIKVS